MADYAKQPRRKYCQFCKDDVEYIDYKDTQMLRKYVTDRGKIKPRRVTGACTQHQRDIAEAVKRARVGMSAKSLGTMDCWPRSWRRRGGPRVREGLRIRGAADDQRGQR